MLVLHFGMTININVTEMLLFLNLMDFLTNFPESMELIKTFWEMHKTDPKDNVIMRLEFPL
ncbi:hypothetical protein D3C86_2153060 [compost metagenome]